MTEANQELPDALLSAQESSLPASRLNERKACHQTRSVENDDCIPLGSLATNFSNLNGIHVPDLSQILAALDSVAPTRPL